MESFASPSPGIRKDGRDATAIRPLQLELRVQRNPEGSALIAMGGTRVLVAASVEDGVPSWLRGQGRGWLSAEYAMHPRANPTRQEREWRKGKVDGRTMEIQRLIGRALRAALRLEALGERQIIVDCDVLDADGGTRTAAINGGFVALAMALEHLRCQGLVSGALRTQVAAISAGWVDGTPMVDLCYEEDSRAQVDLNVVATASGEIVEIQGTAEGAPLARSDFDKLVNLALEAMPALFKAQRDALLSLSIDLDRLSGKEAP
ncbi:MAG: ribonuclease PH [Sandaracinaceae bacterium]|nr:ribonuclease PH [Sandaracinaceae bacterium]MDW8245959.1 ribonuclease PH [Sandaracinaceae bacterium]